MPVFSFVCLVLLQPRALNELQLGVGSFRHWGFWLDRIRIARTGSKRMKQCSEREKWVLNYLWNTAWKIFSFCLVVFVSDVVGISLLETVPLVFIVLFPSFRLLVVNRGHLVWCFADAWIVHVPLLRVLQGLVGLFEQFELVTGFFRLIVVRMVLAGFVKALLPFSRNFFRSSLVEKLGSSSKIS